MSTNRDLLKEAIADAKAVKDMAIANAKAALEEAFTPQLKSMLSTKIQEMEEEEEIEEVMDKEEIEEQEEDLNLEALLAELEEEESDEMVAEAEDEESEDEEPVAEAEDEDEESEDEDEDEDDEEPLDLEDMTSEDLAAFIEDTIRDMIEAGELPAGEGMEDEEELEGEEGEEEVEMVDIEELISEIDTLDEYDDGEEELEEGLKDWWQRAKGSLGFGELADFNDVALKWIQDNLDNIRAAKGNTSKTEEIVTRFEKEMGPKYPKDSYGEFRADMNSLKTMLTGKEAGGKVTHVAETSEELAEAHKTIDHLRSQLNEVNLLNAKLLYVNKIFKVEKSLTESQKVKILETFDKAASVKEVKLVYETLNGTFKSSNVKPTITENAIGSASKGTGTTRTANPVIPVNEAFDRMKTLAFYKSQH